MKNSLPILPLAAAFGLLSLLTSCNKSPESLPAPTAQSQTSDLTYTYFRVPEPLVDVTGIGATNYNSTSDREILTALGQTQLPGGYKIWSRTPPYKLFTGAWQPVAGPNGGGAVKIAATGEGGLYAVDNQNQLWHKAPSTATWQLLPVAAVDVAAYSEQIVYILGPANIPGGHPIYRLRPDGTTYEVFPNAAGVSLAVDQLGAAWVVSSVHEIYVGPYPSGPGNTTVGAFTYVPGRANDITSTGLDIAITGVDYNEVFVRERGRPFGDYAWMSVGGNGAQIAGIETGCYFLVAGNGDLYRSQ